MIDLNVEEPYYSYLASSIKTIEIRLAKPKYKNLKIALLLRINQELLMEVTDLRSFDSFDSLFKSICLKDALPNASSIEKGICLMRKFYSKQEEEIFGVIAIFIKRK